MSQPPPFAKSGAGADPTPPPLGPPAYGPPTSTPGRPNPAGAAVAVLGLVTIAVGAFALALDDYGRGGEYGFVNLRSLAALADGHRGPANHPLFSGLATFWWRDGLFVAGGLATALTVLVVLAPAARAAGWVLAAVAAAGGTLQAFAFAQSADYRTAAVYFAGYTRANVYAHAGPGVWVSLAGFAVLLVGGLLAATLRGRASQP